MTLKESEEQKSIFSQTDEHNQYQTTGSSMVHYYTEEKNQLKHKQQQTSEWGEIIKLWIWQNRQKNMSLELPVLWNA